MGAVTLLDDELPLKKTSKSSSIYVKIGPGNGVTVAMVIDSGADTNCISIKCLEDIGIKEMHRVRAPEVRFAANTTGRPLGMAIVPMKTHKSINTVNV